MANKKKERSPEPTVAAWMGTYGDMITLVLTLFVLLFSFSTIDAKKWEALKVSFMGSDTVFLEALDPFTVGVPFAIDETTNREYRRTSEDGNKDQPEAEEIAAQQLAELEGLTSEQIRQDFDDLYEKIKNHVVDEGLETAIIVEKEDDLITIQMAEVALFNTAKADVKPEAIQMLDIIGGLLSDYKHSIRAVKIEGHTDNVYIYKPPFKSNWELSALRAVNVLRYFIEITDMEERKFSAIAYGEYHPIATNDTDEGKTKNRRVELSIESMEYLYVNANR